MKTTIKALLCAMAIMVAAPAVSNAQMTQKELKKELNKKVDKDSRKEAKALKKDGWKVMPGKLPLDKQIQAAKYSELDKNAEGASRYFTGTHQAIGGNYSAAKQIADNRAYLELAQSVYNDIARKVKDQVASNNFGGKDIEVIDEFISANQSLVSAQLQGAESVIEMYREKDHGQYEVRVFVRIDAEKALKMSKNGYYNLLKEKSQELANTLDKMLDY